MEIGCTREEVVMSTCSAALRVCGRPCRSKGLLPSQRKDSRQVHGLVKTRSSEVGKRKVKAMEVHDLLRKLSE